MQRRNFFKIVLPLVFSEQVLALAGSGEGVPLKFGVIADPQYADKDPGGTRHYRQSLVKLEAAVGELNKEPLDFVVTLGDLIDEDYASFSEVMPRYEKLKAKHYKVFGNHDFEVADKDKGSVAKAMGMPDDYYSIGMRGWRFIFLDGTEVSTFRYPSDDPRTPKAEEERMKLKKAGKRHASWNGGMSEKQLAWLKNQLDASKVANERVIVFNHFPILPMGDGHNLWNAEELVKLLTQYDHVAAYMNGHNHRGNYLQNENTHYLNFKGMVENPVESAYAVVTCFADRIEVEGYGIEPDRKLIL